MPFAELARDRLYQRVAEAICPQELKAEITELGLETSAQVAAHRSLDDLREHLRRRAGEGAPLPEPKEAFFVRAQHEALRGYRLMRHALAVKDPMNQGLRHTSSSLTDAMEEALRTAGEQPFAKPSSLQSNQSAAAYLRHLYRIATGLDGDIGIVPLVQDGPHPLLERRPDLADLELSETNLKQEIPTVRLVNEVLAAALGPDVALDQRFYPVSLPFDAPAESTRAALAQIGGTTLNTVRTRTISSTFPLAQTAAGFRLAWDQAGLLGLTGAVSQAPWEGSEVALLMENANLDAEGYPLTLEHLYGTSDIAEACQVSRLLMGLELDFDALVQALGLYAVEQEHGRPPASNDFATSFIDNIDDFMIRDGSIRMISRPIEGQHLRGLHYIVRLHRSTGLPFHDLNWLLATPGATLQRSDPAHSNKVARRHVTETGLRILATFPLYREAFGLSPQAYAALFGEICPFWRVGTVMPGAESTTAGLEQTEISLFRELFGDDSEWLHRTLFLADSSDPDVDPDAETSIRDPALAKVVGRGLRLSEIQLDALVDALDASFNLQKRFNLRGLGALYRLATVFRMIGWPLLPGLELTQLVSRQMLPDNALWVGLTGKNTKPGETDRLCTALDQLVELSRWMSQAELTPDTLLALLTPTVEADAGMQASADDQNWLQSLGTAAEPSLARAETFRRFQEWELSNGEQKTIGLDDWHGYLTTSAGLYRSSGVFVADKDRQAIEAACRDFLIAAAINPDTETNTPRLERLVDHLETMRASQEQTLERQVLALGGNITPRGAGALIRWSQTNAFDALHTLLPSADDPDHLEARRCLGELRRHTAAVEALDLGDIEVWLVGKSPRWLIAEAAEIGDDSVAPKPLNLLQLFYLQRFVMLQVGAADDEAWRCYLTLAQLGPLDDDEVAWREGCLQALAILLGCPYRDVLAYVDTLIDGPVPDDVAEVDEIARHVRLAEELETGADELLALIGVSDSEKRGEWTVADRAAQTALARFEDGQHEQGFRAAFDEIRRDALVAAYLQLVVANDAQLATSVTDRETLYSHLLLDVSVTSAVPTSRLVEAMSSLQLYISRVLGGLESDVGFVDEAHHARLAEQWQLDRTYRLWEANQKLLLYPQNYLEPDLRYISSPEFEDLLTALSGGDVTENGIETAINEYMGGLDQCCDLSLCSLYVERDEGAPAPVNARYHLLAAANWETGRFFCRTLEADHVTIAEIAEIAETDETDDPKQYLKALDWTFWQQVHISQTHDLFSDVAVAFYKNRYYFFWLELEEQKKQDASGTEQSLWRIHPRYMRCDVNALSGRIRTPGLFAKNLPTDSLLTLDEAFDWRGQKPTLHGAYQPVVRTSKFSYGDSEAGVLPAPDLSEALVVTFGIDFQVSNVLYRSSLEMRLAEEWTDALLLWSYPSDLTFSEHAPPEYLGISPRLPTEDACTVDRGTIAKGIAPDQENGDEFSNFYFGLQGWYERQPSERIPKIHIVNSAQRLDVDATFNPSPTSQLGLGSISVRASLHARSCTLHSETTGAPFDPNGWYDRWYETEAVQVFAQLTLLYRLEGEPTDPLKLETDWVEQAGSGVPFAIDFEDGTFGFKTGGARTAYPPPENIEMTLDLPGDWGLRAGKSATLTVSLSIRRVFPLARVHVVVDGQSKALELEPRDATLTYESFTIGSLLFSSANKTSKLDTGWSLASELGARNFLHILDHPDTCLDTTHVLLNSSSALGSLARMMPLASGVEGLFTWENQRRSEDLGTFLPAFEESLKAIYPEDSTELDPDRAPLQQDGDSRFDFDAAYGGYGWEVFFHIPTAVALGLANSGQYDEALRWLEKIYNPHLDEPWQVYPLRTAEAPKNGLAFDTGHIIVDPDRIATDYPFYYQQATIRRYLETLIAAGDAAYEGETQETLQQAKAIYVQAKQLFREELPGTLDILTNHAWYNPKLGDASADGFDQFLPPYNKDLRDLYDAIEARLANLRHWLDIEGEPLDVGLLAKPIDPRQLQRAAQGSLPLQSIVAGAQDEMAQPSSLNFLEVARSAKAYIANLQITSSRLLAAKEKLDDRKMGALQRRLAAAKNRRSAALQSLAVGAAEEDVALKRAGLGSATVALEHQLRILMKLTSLKTATLVDKALLVKANLGEEVRNLTLEKTAVAVSTYPNIFGTASGGIRVEQGRIAGLLTSVASEAMQANEWSIKGKLFQLDTRIQSAATKTHELYGRVAAAAHDLEKSKKLRAKAIAEQKNIDAELRDLETVSTTIEASFANGRFYQDLVTDLERLFDEEWSATQAFCQLLVALFDGELGKKPDSATSLAMRWGSEVERLNAPYRLALGVERIEAEYIRAIMDRDGGSARMSFPLSQLSALGGDISALEALVDRGEVYFELTDEMFDTLYPGQYDRRIQSVDVRFAGLAKACLSPHARLTQIANTRYLTRERDPRHGGRIRKNGHALQGIVLGAAETDTATLERPEGHLRRFQNTGVESRWHLVLPAVLELKRRSGKGRSKAWRDAATSHFERLKPHLDEIELGVTFCGRW